MPPLNAWIAIGISVVVNLVAVAGFASRYAERVDQQAVALSTSIARRDRQIEAQDRQLAELRSSVSANMIGVARVEYLLSRLLNLQDGDDTVVPPPLPRRSSGRN